MDGELSTPSRSLRYPRVFFIFLAWSAVGALSYTRHYLEGGIPNGGVLLDALTWVMCYYAWVPLTPTVFNLERRFAVGGPGWTRHLVVLAAAGVPAAYLASQISTVLGSGVALAFGQPLSFPPAWWAVAGRELAAQYALYFAIVGTAFIIRRFTRLHEQERQTAQLALEKSQLEASLRQAELETLRMRLNPHFLFNSLQNISILAQHEPKTASQMLTRLGDLLRIALRRDGEAETTLESEIALTEAYVSMEKMRFGDRLMVSFELAAGTEHALVPSFLLQPLVENAILHGLRGVQRTGLIFIRSEGRDGRLVLTISDNGLGLPERGVSELEVGVGLSSTCERLQRMYGERHEFAMVSPAGGGTEVRIAVPLRLKTAVPETAFDEHPALAHR